MESEVLSMEFLVLMDTNKGAVECGTFESMADATEYVAAEIADGGGVFRIMSREVTPWKHEATVKG